MQLLKSVESRLLGRRYVEVMLEGMCGRVSRKDAIAIVARQLGADAERVGIVALEQKAGTTDVVGKFYVYDSAESKKRLHQEHLEIRTLSKEEREKLKQEKKKAQQPAAEAKK